MFNSVSCGRRNKNKIADDPAAWQQRGQVIPDTKTRCLIELKRHLDNTHGVTLGDGAA